MNSVNILGRLTKEPELRYLPDGGQAVCRFSLALEKQLSKEKKQEMESKGDPTADFVNVVVWGKMGENSAKYLAKGRNVAIQGRIQSGSYKAADGTKRYTTDVVAERVQFIDWGDRAGNASSGSTAGFHVDDTITEEDIPF